MDSTQLSETKVELGWSHGCTLKIFDRQQGRSIFALALNAGENGLLASRMLKMFIYGSYIQYSDVSKAMHIVGVAAIDSCCYQ